MEHAVVDRGITRRAPHVLLTAGAVEAAVKLYDDSPDFVFDVETTGKEHTTNELRWIGIGAEGLVHLIPCGHPKGIRITPRQRIKTPAFALFGPDDERSYTPTTRHLPQEQRKPSMRLIEHTVEATYEDPPEQLYPHEVVELLRPLMFSDRGKVGHNVKFDLMTVAKYAGGELPPPPYHDTIILTHVLDEDRINYGLKQLTADWFKVPQAERKAWYPNLGEQGTDNFGLDEVARYLAKDVRYAWLRYKDLLPRLERKQVRRVYDFEMEIYPVVMAMERHGFPVDLGGLTEARADLEHRISGVEHEVHQIAGDQFPLSNLDAKRWVMFGESGKKNNQGQQIPVFGSNRVKLKSQRLRPRGRTPKENLPQVTQAVLEYYAERGNRMAELFGQWSELEKLRGTFIEGIHGYLVPHPGSLPTVHSSFKQHGTKTGRFSCSEMNLQQLPKGDRIRKLFVAGPRRVVIVADYDQIELRCAGFLSGDPTMIQVFLDGRDIHREAAVAMFRIVAELITDELRQVGKTQNFAVLYGAGEAKIAAVAGCSMERASELIRSYFQTFAQLEKWKYRELQLARKRGDRQNPWSEPPRVVIPPFGRLRRLPELFNLEQEYLRYHAERQAINAICQGFAAYITKLAMVGLHRELPEDSYMVAQVHDEIVTLAPEDEAEDVKKIVTTVMESVLDPLKDTPILGEIPLVASAGFGASWSEAKK